jgi:hypothetical protein
MPATILIADDRHGDPERLRPTARTVLGREGS